MLKKECPQCNSKLREIIVEIEDADSPVKSHQCGKCGYFDFEKKSIKKAIDEIKTKEMVSG
jgi:ribosomal protein S27AE